MSVVEVHGWGGSWSLLVFQCMIVALFVFLLWWSIRRCGWKKSFRLFIPMFIAALFLESAAVASGRYSYSGYFVYLSVIGGSVPLIILLGWNVNLLLFLGLGERVLNGWSQSRLYVRMVLVSLVAGMFGVCLDMLEDPIAQSNQWWIWTQQTTVTFMFRVPISNFVDWFLILFFMSLATQLIDRSALTENRKLLLSLISVSYVGAFIFLVHTLLFGVF
ncbi:MAG: carotenoid biosynthesis protein [Methanobacteriota archaeon]